MPLTIVQQLEALNGKADIDTITQLFNDIDPSICIKPYKDESNLLLIHNDFNSKNVTNIYKECRSFTLAIDNLVAKIVSYSHETFHNIDFVPEHMSAHAYRRTHVRPKLPPTYRLP